MPSTLVTVSYHLSHPDGTPWRHRLVFELLPGSYDDFGQFPKRVLYGQVDANGDGSIELWANEEGQTSSAYKVIWPSGEEFFFTIPATGGPWTLSELLAAGVTSSQPQYSSVLALIAPYLSAKSRGAAGDGVTHDTVKLQLADGDALSAGKILAFPKGIYLLDDNTTLTAERVKFSPGAVLQVASGKTLTINGDIEAGPLQAIVDLALGGNLVIVRPQRAYPQWLGALADDNDASKTANNRAVEKLIAALPAYSILEFPAASSPIVLDQEFFFTRSISIWQTGGGYAARIANNSAIVNDNTNLYGRSLFNLRASDISVRRVRVDGNSRNNKLTVAGLDYYCNSSNFLHPEIGSFGCGLWMVGFYGASIPGQADLSSIVFKDCRISDAPQQGIDSYQQGFAHTITGLRILDCEFDRCQGVQIAFSCVVDGLVRGCRHTNPYFTPFQYYYQNLNCSYQENTVRLDHTSIDFTKVDPYLKVTTDQGVTICTQEGQVRLGKTDEKPNIACHCKNNTILGASIEMLPGMEYSDVEGNLVYKSETIGIGYTSDTAGYGNRIRGNKIIQCDQAGLYLSDSAHPCLVEDNELYGNCTRLLSHTYGSRDLRAQIVIWDKDYVLRRNSAKVVGASASYGVILFNPGALSSMDVALEDNDFTGSGVVADCVNNDGSSPPVPVALSTLHASREWSWEAASLASAAIYQKIPAGISGFAICQLGAELAGYSIVSAAGSTTVTKAFGSANTSDTDVADKMCLYASGDRALFRNELAGAHPAHVRVFYRA